ncbi:MAG: hypothetical protein ACW987_18440 [Candidatus Thorarchaeota archaeon]
MRDSGTYSGLSQAKKMMKAMEIAKTATIAGPVSIGVPGEPVPLVGCVVVVVSVGDELVEVVDETINHCVSECPLLQVAVTVRLSPAVVETVKVSYMPQWYD